MEPIIEPKKKPEELMKIYFLEAWYDGENSVDYAAGISASVPKAVAEMLIALGTAEPEV
jgi:hypothetical protein